MANEDLGVKRDCPECSARFYDLQKDPCLCPKCGNEFVPEVILKPRRPRPVDEVAEDQNKDDKESEEEEEADEAVAPLEAADEENAEIASKRKAGLDEDEDEDEPETEDDIPDLDDIEDVEIDENDDTLLDTGDDDDVEVLVSAKDKGADT